MNNIWAICNTDLYSQINKGTKYLILQAWSEMVHYEGVFQKFPMIYKGKGVWKEDGNDNNPYISSNVYLSIIDNNGKNRKIPSKNFTFDDEELKINSLTEEFAKIENLLIETIEILHEKIGYLENQLEKISKIADKYEDSHSSK